MEFDARVFIYNEKNRTLFQLATFISLQIEININGTSNAQVTLLNKDDKWYTTDANIRRTDEHIQYVKHILQLERVNFLKREMQDIASAVVTQKSAKNNFELLRKVFTLSQEFELLNRIWIDLRDENGQWYTAFTGFITSIEDSYVAKSQKSLTLHCRGLERFLEISDVLVLPGITPLRVFQSLHALYQQQKPELRNVMTSSKLQGMTAQEIFFYVLELVNEFYGFRENALNNRELYGLNNSFLWNTSHFKVKETKVKQSQIIENLFVTAGDWSTTNSYFGLSNKIFNTPFLSTSITLDANISGAEKETKICQLLGRNIPYAVIDPNLVNIQVFSEVIRSTFEFYQNQTEFASEILEKVRQITLADLYLDSSGNFIFQLPKYNQLPPYRQEINGNESDLGAFEKNLDGSIILNSKAYQNFHGIDYLLGDKKLISFQFGEDESRILTKIFVTAEANYMFRGDQQLDSVLRTGSTQPDPNLEAKYGLRSKQFTAPSVAFSFLNVLPSTYSNAATRFVDVYAEALKARLNSDISTASITLLLSPNLQLGRTAYFIERDKLLYISRIRHAFEFGANATTSIEGTYVHRPYEYIPDPWIYASKVFQEVDFNKLSDQAREVQDTAITFKPIEDTAITKEVKGYFKYPANKLTTKLTSSFGIRTHPIYKKYKKHLGIDIAPISIAKPELVYASAEGIVKFVGEQSGYGLSILLQHYGKLEGYETFYAHLKNAFVKLNQFVCAEEAIGLMGSSGISTSIHLHFEVRYNKVAIDPITVLERRV